MLGNIGENSADSSSGDSFAAGMFQSKLAWLIMLFGAALRVLRYFQNRSFWLDESNLSINFVHKTFGQLFWELDNGQSAPIGYLFLVKLVGTLFGYDEFALRLPSLMAAIAALPLFYWVACMLMGTRRAQVALFIFGINIHLIHFGAEAKQYGFDVIAVLILLGLSIRAIKTGCSRKGLIAVGIAGLVVLPFSHASVFVLAGVGSVLILFLCLKRRRRDVYFMFGIAFLWIAWFLPMYIGIYRHANASGFLLEYWRDYFYTVPTGLWDLRRKFESLLQAFSMPGNFEFVGLAAVLFVLGVTYAWRANRWLAVLLISPVVVTLTASAVQVYPFAVRLILFLSPIMIIGVTWGICEIWRMSGRGVPRLGAALGVGILLFHPLFDCAYEAANQPVIEDVRALAFDLDQQVEPGHAIANYFQIDSGIRYYRDTHALKNLANAEYLGEIYSLVGEENYKRDIMQLVDEREYVWIVFTQYPPGSREDLKLIRSVLDEKCRVISTLKHTGVIAILYQANKSVTQ